MLKVNYELISKPLVAYSLIFIQLTIVWNYIIALNLSFVIALSLETLRSFRSLLFPAWFSCVLV